jgi:hypothetical protein
MKVYLINSWQLPYMLVTLSYSLRHNSSKS